MLERAVILITTARGAFRAETGFEGEFQMNGIGGSATLLVTAPGYDSQSTSMNITTDALLDLRLRRAVGRAVTCGDGPDTGNRVLPVFSSPFAGTFALSNYFDHELPTASAPNGYQLNFCGEKVTGRIDGHAGYDWLLPVGTPLVAVADGVVIAAGTDLPFFCEVLHRTVTDQRFVEIRHPTINGESFSSVFVHLSRIDVDSGQTVTRGQGVGLSGNTGCSTEPHLHLHVWRFTNTNAGRPTVVDPYGWEGPTQDPWAQEASGSSSIWLWRPGEAPALRPR